MPASSEPAPFVERYVAGWSLADRPASSIAFAGVTDAVLFSLLPRPDGSIDAATNGLTEARIAEVKARAPRTLVAIGGEKTASRFRSPKLAASLARFVIEHELDGVVIDVEPLAELPHETFASLVSGLATAIAPRPVRVVVAPSADEIARLGPVVGDVERVAIMSYLGEPPAERERSLVDALVALGFDRPRIGLGIGPRTPPARARERTAAAGGVILWGGAELPAQ